ncbi:50S ribosomal protein L19e [Candidatus Woesearchaeota archaeon]|nr:MAG: 50S ribosomal protein L19e [Candidatus Woesearchaeota archaeon]
MRLKSQRKLAAQILKCAEKRVVFDTERIEDIKEAITKADIRGLIHDKVITAKPAKGVSRVRAKKRQIQKRKGKRTGKGSRKGGKKARNPKKKTWMNRIRIQRKFLQELRDKKMITSKDYRSLYQKAKGGFFRSKRHVKLFITEKGLMRKDAKKKK